MKLMEKLIGNSENTYVASSTFAMLSMTLGDLSQTFEWLEKAYDERDSCMAMLNSHPFFLPIRSDPRFQAFLQRMNFPSRT
jgi:hypothetical protein